MKSLLTAVVFLALVSGVAFAQRFEPGASSLEDYRKDGELRMWTFVFNDSTVGRLFSTVKGKTDVNGVEAHIIEQRLGLDFARYGSGVTIDVDGRQFVGHDGVYLGSDLNFKTGDLSAHLELKRDGDSLRGYVEQGGIESDQQHQFRVDGFAADIYLLDMHELFLAMRDVKVGDTIRDTLFVPQIMQKQYVEATVDLFVNKEVYKGKFDSSFVITYTYPQRQAFYFTPDKRLVKAEIPGQRVKAYLDMVREFEPGPAGTPGRTVSDFVSKLPVFAAYFVLGLLSLVFFVGRAYRRSLTWLAFIAGGVVYIVVPFTQMPLQTSLTVKLFIPSIAAGGSPYFWGLFPALTTGVIQELLKAVLIVTIGLMSGLRTNRMTVIGAVCGAGFGIVEGCHLVMLATGVELFSWHLLERGFMILFHATSGALIGHALAAGVRSRRFGYVFGGLVLFDAFLRYLPVFVQQGVVVVQMMFFVIPILVIALTFFTLWRLRRAS